MSFKRSAVAQENRRVREAQPLPFGTDFLLNKAVAAADYSTSSSLGLDEFTDYPIEWAFNDDKSWTVKVNINAVAINRATTKESFNIKIKPCYNPHKILADRTYPTGKTFKTVYNSTHPNSPETRKDIFIQAGSALR